MKTPITLILLFFCIIALAKAPDSDKILKEGQLLYRLEKASWYGTDFFMENFYGLRDNIGGYLSYETDNHHITNIFFDKTNPFKIIIRFQFDSLPTPKPLKTDTIDHVASLIDRT